MENMKVIAATSLIQAFVGKPGLAARSWVLKATFETIRVSNGFKIISAQW